ncbi:hypothetical protein O181_014868 [Austropuccinia psidii MF-1]|uniref:Uncharacterized protein n=1 Tax=Austropuccinia psidii MF-1 TaxID=1389203 RepID=A0A9Q3C225_9BASI|nr:hypothetical protein [Austropuccinia psidii MF-1]
MWTPIATQRDRKPQNSASIQGKPTLTTCTGNITVINPAVTSKGKLPKAAYKKFVQGTVKDLAFQRNHPEDRLGLSRTRRPGRGHLGHNGGWKDIEGTHTHSAIHIPIQQKPKTEDWKDMDKVLQLHQLLKELFQWSMDNKRFNIASHWEEL